MDSAICGGMVAVTDASIQILPPSRLGRACGPACPDKFLAMKPADPPVRSRGVQSARADSCTPMRWRARHEGHGRVQLSRFTLSQPPATTSSLTAVETKNGTYDKHVTLPQPHLLRTSQNLTGHVASLTIDTNKTNMEIHIRKEQSLVEMVIVLEAVRLL